MHDQRHELETDNNLNDVGNFQTDRNIPSIYYSKSEDLYWSIPTYIISLSPNVYETTIQKRNTSGQLIGTLNFKSIIPVADRYPIDWNDVIGSSITLSPDKTEIYGIFSKSKRVYRISKAGAYLGYFDLDGVTGTKQVGGITSDDTSIWYTVYDPANIEVIECDTSGNTLNSFSISNLDPDFENVYYLFDLSFSDETYGGKRALWFRTASKTLTNQALLAVELEAKPCQGFPVINASDKVIVLNSVFDPMNGVTATDCSGKDITNLVTITANNVDTTQVGTYQGTYAVTVSNGRTTTKSITVTVVGKTPLTREQAFTYTIESVAFEQTALSHILNAEGEKLQKIIANPNVTTELLLKTNKSVNDMVGAISRLDMVLQSKLELIQCGLCEKQ